MDNIILIGYRGSGKTQTGKIIARKLKLDFISIDKKITDKIGPINDFVEKNNWEKFREIEEDIIGKIDADNTVVDCGGGVVESGKNIGHLKKLGRVIWLKADVQKIIERIKDKKDLPSLTNKSFTAEVEEILEKREPLYRKTADFEVDTNNKTIREVADEILGWVK